MSIEPVISTSVSRIAVATGAEKAEKRDSPAKIQQAASEFEAFLLAQMLKSAREASSGGLTSDGDEGNGANSTMMELGEQQFAQALASSGGLGIAKMIVTGLAKHADR